jgi:hypothetical protein
MIGLLSFHYLEGLRTEAEEESGCQGPMEEVSAWTVTFLFDIA